MAILPLQLARVSNLLRTSVAQQTIARTQQQMLQVQNELSSGKKINSPSDNPGDAAIVQQLQKTLEQRKGYADNLKQAQSQLSEVDSTLGDLSGLLLQAQQIASANVGSDVTPDQRQSAATIIQSIYSQVLSIGNKQFQGAYLFGGDRSTAAPFVVQGSGVQFVGSTTNLKNTFDEGTVLPFTVNGSDVFGALSTRIQGATDMSPSLSTNTRLRDLSGSTLEGVQLGTIVVGNGTTSAMVDLSQADTIGDVITKINAAGVGSITASIAPDGNSLRLSGGGSEDITVTDVGGTTAANLGILQTTAAGAGTPVDGSNVNAKVTRLTTLASLKGGAGIDTSGLIITNGGVTKTIDLSTAVTVEDLLNAVNGSGTGVLAEINAAGTGINILNPTQGVSMTIAENGGTTATDLGVRSYLPTTPLSELNNGRGVATVSGADFLITRRDGTSFTVDLGTESTIQDVIDAINAADGGGGITASFATTGNGIVLTDTSVGAGSPSVVSQNFSTAAADLGLNASASGAVIQGSDVNAVAATGIFSNLMKLRDSLNSNDQQAITAAAESLQSDYGRVTRVRGQTGAQVQELEARQERLEDQNVATKALLSSLQDTDFTDAISRFQTLQTQLQASLETSSRILNMSLLDYLG